jgi:hypothetical protein
MKYCKHYLIFLLTGALLLLPVTSHYAYAISWDDIKKNIASFFNENTLQKIVPGGIIALGLAGGLYYWWATRKSGNPIRSIVPLNYVWPTLEQFQVYCQFNYDGGGGASCGYHALLRGMQIVQAKAHHESDETLQETLESRAFIDQYFGKNGTWRQAIIQKKTNDNRQGDWLDDSDLEYLWKNYRNDILDQNINCGFFVIPNFGIVGTEFSELEIDIKDNVRSVLNTGQLFRIFILGTMEHKYGEEAGTEGHWYPLVMYQNEIGKRKYYITDSGSWGETNRLNDPNVWKIIDLIEQ